MPYAACLLLIHRMTTSRKILPAMWGTIQRGVRYLFPVRRELSGAVIIVCWLAGCWTDTLSAAPPAEPAMVTLSGEVIDESSHPAAGAEVIFETYRDFRLSATTEADGRFTLQVPENAWKWRPLIAQREEGRIQGVIILDGKLKPEGLSQLKLTMAPAREMSVRVVDGGGQPLPGASVGVIANYLRAAKTETDASGEAKMYLPKEMEIQQVYAVKNDFGFDYRSFVLPRLQRNDLKAVKPEFPQEGITLSLDGAKPLTVIAKTSQGEPIPDLTLSVWLLQKPGESDHLNLSYLRDPDLFVRKTDQEGRVTFAWIPAWQTSQLQIWPSSSDFAHERIEYDPMTGDGTLETQLLGLVPVRGKVLRPDGSPAGGATIGIAGAGHATDRFQGAAKSNADGTFETKVSPNQVYLMVARDQQFVSAPQTGFAVWPDTPIENLEFQLRPATRIHGRLTAGSDTPLAGKTIFSYQYGQDLHSQPDVNFPNPDKSLSYVQPLMVHVATTDSDGKFEFFLGPGKHDIRDPNQENVKKFEISDEIPQEFNFQMPLSEKLILKGLVVSGQPQQPVVKALVSGVYRASNIANDFTAKTDATGRFEVERKPHPVVLCVKSEDDRLGAIVNIDAETPDTTIPLGPNGSAKGILIDGETDQPMAKRELQYGIQVVLEEKNQLSRYCFGGKIVTDAEGKFELKGLVAGHKYIVILPMGNGSLRRVAEFFPESAVETDLGKAIMEPIVAQKPPTLEERIQETFAAKSTPLERLEKSLPDAKLGRMRVMLLVADPANETVRELMKLKFEDNDIALAFSDYRFIAINAFGEHRPAAEALAEKLLRKLPEGPSPFLILVTDEEGNLIGGAEADDLLSEGSVSKDQVLELLKRYSQTPLDAQTLYEEALAQAKQENKRVIVQESATWCGPCWMLSRFFEKHHEVLDADYIRVKIDHRWTGAKELMQKLRGDAPGGIPWWIILDAEGNKLVTSSTPEGENIGFPASTDEIAHFRQMLEKTAQHLTPAQIDELAGDLNRKK